MIEMLGHSSALYGKPLIKSVGTVIVVWVLGGIGFNIFDTGVIDARTDLTASILFISALVLVGVGTFVVSVKEARKKLSENLQESGQCTVCGYDLRATPDRCPECGTVPAEKA